MNKLSVSDCISKIGLETEMCETLAKNDVLNIGDLWSLKRNDLKKIGLSSTEIKHIKIKMQLHSIDLNKKKYGKN